MRLRVLFVLTSAALLAVALSGMAVAASTPPAPYAEPTDCLTCHTVGGVAATAPVDFSVGAVDKNACTACHGSIPLVGYEDHFHGGLKNCNGCHSYPYYQWPDFLVPAGEVIESLVTTPFGKFQATTSPDASVSTVHSVHRGAGWVQSSFSSIHPEYNCQNCHAAASCSACHTGVVHGSHGGNTCESAGCHVTSRSGVSVPTCASCHPAGSAATHDVSHTATDGSVEGIACSACHALALVDEHAKTSSTSATAACAACHPAPADGTAPAWDGACATAGCHTVASSAPMHAGIASAHAVSSANTLCLDCHGGTELGSIHADAVSTTDSSRSSCLVCHTASAPPATSDCTSCHFTFDAHYDSAKHAAISVTCTGAGCHDTSLGLMGLHQQRNAAFDCWGCHNSVRTDVQYAIDNNLTGCGDCHSDIYGSTGHRTVHWPVPVLQDAEGPHYSYYTGSAGTAPTGDCAGCHTSNLMDEHMGLYLDGVVFVARKDSAGNDLTCDTCHASGDSRVIAAIASGSKSCESCHDVHGPIPNVHTSAFVDAPELECAGCHDANLAAEHDGGYTSSVGLTGCGVCHALYSGVSGSVEATAVQDAISVSNSTKCSACHSSYHAGMAPHEAVGTASLACGDCHGAVAAGALDVNTIHPACTTCHGAPDGRIDWATATFECAGCHVTQGVDFHSGMAAHVTPTTGCSISGCHHSNSDVSAFHPSCTTCHTGTTDLGMTTACENCHGTVQGTDFHVNFDALHTPTDEASAACVGCHDTADVTQLHVTQSCETCHFKSGCLDCHAMHGMGGIGLTLGTSCSRCHTAEGTDYHDNMTAGHTYSAMPESCTTGSNCHVANTLPEEHARVIAEYGYASTCDLCHKNSDPARIDWATASADCSTCHQVHGDIAALHTASASQACVDCHETGDLLTLHKNDADVTDCDMCHAAASGRIDWTTANGECTSCHSALSPTDPSHYDAVVHDASAETGCNQCHYKDMKAEHLKTTVAVSCVVCHETKVDAFTAAWDKTCSACHPTKHGDRATKHASTNTACGGTSCHNISDVAAIHDVVGGPGCGACHTGPATPATSTDCTGCHPGVSGNHHEAHNAASANPGGCQGCHIMYLDDEHATLGLTCDTCHKSTATAVVNAIKAGDVRCKSCHPNMHSAQNYEFNPNMAGGHRVSADLPGMRSSFGVNGATYTWSLPSATSFLKSGWTTSSVMGCDACHTYSGAAGPHGATMQVNVDPAYPNSYNVTTGSSTATAQLSPNSPTGMSMTRGGSSAAGIICEKCHDLNGTGSNFSNVVHKEHDDRGSEGAYCNQCHIGVPHGWGRPRLLGYTSDPAPYGSWRGTSSSNGGLTRIALKNYTPSSWQKSDCGAACSSDRHPLSGTSWPNAGTAPGTNGTVSGTVRNATGSGISGAVVSVGGKSATTATGGTYSVADVAAGSQAMTISASGYTTWSGTVNVTAGGTVTQNVTLVAAPPVPTTGTVTGTITNASTSAAISGATVTVGGKTATTGNDGGYTIVDLAAGTYTMTAAANGYTGATASVSIVAGQTATQDLALSPSAGTPTNLARTGTASSSSADSAYYSASRAIDGNTGTYWRSNGHDYEWLRVDLGATRAVSKVVVNWYGTRYARSYRIETSTDGWNWTQRYTTSSANGGVDEITLSSATARYVRVYCTSANDSDYRISEFEVWGN